MWIHFGSKTPSQQSTTKGCLRIFARTPRTSEVMMKNYCGTVERGRFDLRCEGVSQRFADFRRLLAGKISCAECRIVFCLTNTSIQWFQIMTKYVTNMGFGLVLGQKIVHHNDVQISPALFFVFQATLSPFFLCFKQRFPPTKNTKKHQKTPTPQKTKQQKNSTPKWPRWNLPQYDSSTLDWR